MGYIYDQIIPRKIYTIGDDKPRTVDVAHPQRKERDADCYRDLNEGLHTPYHTFETRNEKSKGSNNTWKTEPRESL